MVCSKFWKLDKIDKIVIAFTFIVVTMFSIFNCFSYASTEVLLDSNVLEGYSYDSTLDSIQVNTTTTMKYWRLNPYSDYIVISNIDNSPRRLRILNTLEVNKSGAGVYDFIIQPNSSVTLDLKEYQGYKDLFLYTSAPNSEVSMFFNIDVYEFVDSGFNAAIKNLANNVGIFSLWNTFEFIFPFALIVVVVAFGIYLIIRMIKGLSKGKGRL